MAMATMLTIYGTTRRFAFLMSAGNISVCISVFLDAVLFLLVSTVAFAMLGLGFARGTAMFALLDWAAFGSNMMQFSVMMRAPANPVTFDAG